MKPSELRESQTLIARKGDIEMVVGREYGTLHLTVGPPTPVYGEYGSWDNVVLERAYHAALISIDLPTEAEIDAVWAALINNPGVVLG